MRRVWRAPWLAGLLFAAVAGCRAAGAVHQESDGSALGAAPPNASALGAPPLGASALGPAPASESAAMPDASALGAAPPNASALGPAPPRQNTKGAACPAEMAEAGKACIDRWEAHLVVLGPSGAPSLHPHAQRPAEGVRYVARSEAGVFPQAYISRLEAKDACVAAGKRLCTLSEWYRACRGSKGTTYPYGWNEQKKSCNIEKPHLLGKLFGNDPRRWDYAKHFNDPALDDMPGWLARTGEYAECKSDYGTFDMVGNLHEWVSDVVDETLEQKLPLRDDIRKKIGVNTGHGIFMGGFFSTGSEHGRGCGFVTIGHEPKYHDYSTGFRCCKDRER